MAEILVLSRWRDRKGWRGGEQGALVAPAVSTARGEVVLFTGVRYERFDGAVQPAHENTPLRVEQN